MFTSAIKYIASLAHVVRQWPGFTVALTSGLSIVLAGSSLYIFAFAGRSMLPGPVAGDIPIAPYVISMPVKAAPAVPVPVPPTIIPEPVPIVAAAPLAAIPAAVDNVSAADTADSADSEQRSSNGNGSSARTARISLNDDDEDKRDDDRHDDDHRHEDHDRHDD